MNKGVFFNSVAKALIILQIILFIVCFVTLFVRIEAISERNMPIDANEFAKMLNFQLKYGVAQIILWLIVHLILYFSGFLRKKWGLTKSLLSSTLTIMPLMPFSLFLFIASVIFFLLPGVNGSNYSCRKESGL